MGGRSAGGLVLLLVGSLGLIGYLTGNLDRWLGALFAPGGSSSAAYVPAGASSPAAPAPGAVDRRVSSGSLVA